MEVLTTWAVIASGCRVAQRSPFRYLQRNEGSTPRKEARRACSWSALSWKDQLQIQQHRHRSVPVVVSDELSLCWGAFSVAQ